MKKRSVSFDDNFLDEVESSPHLLKEGESVTAFLGRCAEIGFNQISQKHSVEESRSRQTANLSLITVLILKEMMKNDPNFSEGTFERIRDVSRVQAQQLGFNYDGVEE